MGHAYRLKGTPNPETIQRLREGRSFVNKGVIFGSVTRGSYHDPPKEFFDTVYHGFDVTLRYSEFKGHETSIGIDANEPNEREKVSIAKREFENLLGCELEELCFVASIEG